MPSHSSSTMMISAERFLLNHPRTLFSIRRHLYVTPALIFGLFSLLLFLHGYLTAYWLQIWYGIDDSPFKNIGLWQACFSGMRHPMDYDLKKFHHGCWWLYAKEFSNLRKFGPEPYLLPSWFVSTQVFATLALLMCLISFAAVFRLVRKIESKKHEVEVDKLVCIVPALYILTAILTMSALLIFGNNALKTRSKPVQMEKVTKIPYHQVINVIGSSTWLPKADYSFFSYSFVTTTLSAFCSLVSGVLVFCEQRMRVIRCLRSDRSLQR